MKKCIILLSVLIGGCASQPRALTEAERSIHVFNEEPKIAYEALGRVDATNRARHAIDVMDKVLIRAAELGADGVIVHATINKGLVAGGADVFGTGGGGGFSVYQIQATAIRYLEDPPPVESDPRN